MQFAQFERLRDNAIMQAISFNVNFNLSANCIQTQQVWKHKVSQNKDLAIIFFYDLML